MVKTKPNRKKYTRNYKNIFRIGRVSLGLLTLILFLLINGLYLIQTNRIAVRGYELTELEKKVDTLKEENTKDKLEASKLKSVNLIRNEIKDGKMVPAGEINYVYPNKDFALKE